MSVSTMSDMDEPLFSGDDDDTPIARPDEGSWKVLVVDDDDDMLAVTRLVFSSFRYQDKPIKLITAKSAQEARARLEEEDGFALAFIDVVMETDHAGLDLVRHIRDTLHNDEIQLILRTGQPGYAPEMKVILEYGINDYRTKVELDNVKLISCLVAGLRNYHNLIAAREAVGREAIASELNQAKSLFFAQMSHDLRTPLNSVLGFCQLLEVTPLNDEQREHIKYIRESGHHLLALVNDILDLSKGEAGKIQLESIPFSLHELAHDTAKFLAPQAHSGVTFECEIDTAAPDYVLGDPVRVRQILYNLLSNALKFTHRGHVRLVVEPLPSEVASTQRVQLTVDDTGQGIPAANLSTLFDVYEQGDASVNRSHGGTGLGLYICRQLAELMGGGITVTSEEGKGSAFQVVLSFTPAPPPEAPPVRPLTPKRQVRFGTVLVVDDDQVNRMLLQKMLERRGMEVVCAANGAQALAKAGSAAFDLILMDCQMPDMDGLEATRQIRTLKGYEKVPIVALTGNGEDDMASCFRAGMNDYMSKPVDLDSLWAMVSKWLGFRTMMK